MSRDLAGFLAKNARRERVEVMVSERFTDGQGEPLLWELEPVTAADMEELLQAEGEAVRYDQVMLGLLCRAVRFPDLQDAGLQDSYGVMGAERLLLRMLSPGEFRVLQAAFERQNLAGPGAELVAQAKN